MPNCVTYDPAYAYEIAVIVQDGIRRMYQEGEELFYYITLYNENYPMPAMPGRRRKASCAACIKFQAAAKGKAKVQLFGSGPILNEALRAQDMLAEKYGVAADVWSVTSYKELRRDALHASAGTGCIPPSRREAPTSGTLSKEPKAPSWPLPIT